MSASREKKKRQELASSGGGDAKTAKEAEQKAAEKHTMALYTVAGIAFVVLAVVLVVYNSGILQRGKTAVTIDGQKFNAGQMNYYYNDAYQSFIQQTGGYASVLYGLDTSKPLDEQECPLAEEEGQSWEDYFKSQAVENMRYIYACKKDAGEQGVKLEDSDMETFDSTVKSIKSAAAQNGYSYSSYISAMYGQTVTTGIFESCLKDQILADKVGSNYQDSLEYTDDELQAYYEENKNTYDLVDGGYITISGKPETETDEDGNTVEPTDEEKETALGIAEQTAKAILAAYEDGKDPEELASAYSVSANVSEALTYTSGVAMDWLFDESRKEGDAEMLTDEANSMYYVAFFNGRKRDDALEYNVRHILITKDSLELGEDEEATQEQLEAKAQEILDKWDGTEDNFAALAEEYSKDPGSNTNGGLYENVQKGRMVAPFNDWCYEDGRKPGDTGIVYNSSTGAHIMYFVGYGEEEYWHFACTTMKKNEAFTAWKAEMTESVTADVNDSGMDAVG